MITVCFFWSLVELLGHLTSKGCYCQVMELLDANVRQVIYRNERKGLSAWGTQKFAKDMLR